MPPLAPSRGAGGVVRRALGQPVQSTAPSPPIGSSVPPAAPSAAGAPAAAPPARFVEPVAVAPGGRRAAPPQPTVLLRLAVGTHLLSPGLPHQRRVDRRLYLASTSARVAGCTSRGRARRGPSTTTLRQNPSNAPGRHAASPISIPRAGSARGRPPRGADGRRDRRGVRALVPHRRPRESSDGERRVRRSPRHRAAAGGGRRPSAYPPPRPYPRGERIVERDVRRSGRRLRGPASRGRWPSSAIRFPAPAIGSGASPAACRLLPRGGAAVRERGPRRTSRQPELPPPFSRITSPLPVASKRASFARP